MRIRNIDVSDTLWLSAQSGKFINRSITSNLEYYPITTTTLSTHGVLFEKLLLCRQESQDVQRCHDPVIHLIQEFS